jgi:N-methylhydantoinase B
MGNTLLRTGRSGVLNRAKDFSCCILTARGDLLPPRKACPSMCCRAPTSWRARWPAFTPSEAGDVFLHNSPYHGNSHPADHTLLMPVIGADNVHRFTLVAKAHQADIGNSMPTTYVGTAQDVYEEGALIFPGVKVAENYTVNQDIVRMCRMRIRVPNQWHGDFLAMLGAVRIGEREILEMGEELGWAAARAFTRTSGSTTPNAACPRPSGRCPRAARPRIDP